MDGGSMYITQPIELVASRRDEDFPLSRRGIRKKRFPVCWDFGISKGNQNGLVNFARIAGSYNRSFDSVWPVFIVQHAPKDICCAIAENLDPWRCIFKSYRLYDVDCHIAPYSCLAGSFGWWKPGIPEHRNELNCKIISVLAIGRFVDHNGDFCYVLCLVNEISGLCFGDVSRLYLCIDFGLLQDREPVIEFGVYQPQAGGDKRQNNDAPLSARFSVCARFVPQIPKSKECNYQFNKRASVVDCVDDCVQCVTGVPK